MDSFTAVLSHTCTARIKSTAVKREVGGRQSNCVYKTHGVFTSVGLRNMSESDEEVVVGIQPQITMKRRYSKTKMKS